MPGGEDLSAAVSRELAFLIRDHGVHLVSGNEVCLRLESALVGVEMRNDPREGMEVEAFRLGHESVHERSRYSGMIGRAQVLRLLQIAGERMRSVSGVIEGDPAPYACLKAPRPGHATWRGRGLSFGQLGSRRHCGGRDLSDGC